MNSSRQQCSNKPVKARSVSRRRLLVLAASSLPVVAVGGRATAAPDQAGETMEFTRLQWTDAQWREALSPEQFRVLRREGTERSGSSPLDREYRAGTYLCAGCNLALFSSTHKFDSGTGWPSFWQPIDDRHIGTKRDFKLIWPRTEYHCARCDGHQGHVFDDGPPPTHQRWCNNGVALRFIPDGEPLPDLRSSA